MKVALWKLSGTEGFYLDRIAGYLKDSVPDLEVLPQQSPSPETAFILIAGSIPRRAHNPNIDAMMEQVHATGFASERIFLQGDWETEHEWERVKQMVATGDIAGYINFGVGGVGIHLAPALAGVPTLAPGPSGYHIISADDDATLFIQ